MVELRRWLLSSSSHISIAGVLFLAATGCTSTREYAATSDYSGSDWTTAEPLAPVAELKKTKPVLASPYEEPSTAAPGPEALLEPTGPAPAPAADMIDDVQPAEPFKAADTVVIDDVAPAPLPTAASKLPASIPETSQPATLSETDAVAETSDENPVVATPAEAAIAEPTAVEPQIDLPMPEANVVVEPAAPSTELPAATTESLIPGLPVDSAPAADESPQNETTPSDQLPATGLEQQETQSGIRPLFPGQKIRTVASVSRPDSLSRINSARPTVKIDVPSPDAGRRSSTSDIAVIAQLESEAVHIAFDNDGNLLVAHEEGLSRLAPNGKVEFWAQIASPRGFAQLPDRTFAVCDARQRSILKVNATGSSYEILAQRSDGRFLRAPGFIAVDEHGGVYFSDPGYARITAATGRLHYVDAVGNVTLVSQRLAYPEGIGLSADGTRLFVVESQNNRVLSFDILTAGQVGAAQTYCSLSPKQSSDADDFATGLAIDQSGRLFVARHGMRQIDVIDANGRFDRSIEVPNVFPRSLALSQDQSDLFVAGTSAKAQWSGLVVRVPVGK
ncbi:MAG: SMP-30/gluconolactonase/LRE family protein [Planctomycetota bacterium]|jgi:sugar lactone lactonase YvrE